MPHQHPLDLLAAERGYLVQLCRDCNIVHVDVGPVTLRLRPSALDSLAQVLGRASESLRHVNPDEDTAHPEHELIRPLLTN